MIRNLRCNFVILLAGASLSMLPLSAPAAKVVGSSVTGGLYFSGGTTNYFDPANGYVPSGYLNYYEGTTVTVASPGVEFGYQNTSNIDSVDLSASQLTLEDTYTGTASGANAPFKITLTDPAFFSLSFAQVSNSFTGTGVSVSESGDTLTLTWAGGTVPVGSDYTSTVIYTAVPEPSTDVAALTGAAVLALAAWRRRLARA